MLRATAATVVVAAGMCCCGPLQRVGGVAPFGERRFVLANGGLNVRASPDEEAPVLQKAPWGAEVVVTGDGVGSAFADGVQGRWVPVWVDGDEGFAFDGFLGRWAPPPEPCAGLSAWSARIGAARARTLKARGTCEDCPDAYELWTTPLDGGATLEEAEGWEWGSEELTLPGTTMVEAWLAGRRCFPEVPPLAKMPYPSTGRALPGADGAAGTVQVGDGRIVVTWSDLGTCSFTVERLGTDARISTECAL